MSFIKLIESFSLEGRTKEEKENFLSRKDAFKKMGSWGKNMAIASLPVGVLTAMPKIAFASQAAVVDVLKYALTLEYLEYNFYNHGLLGPDVTFTLTDDEKAIITLIRDHEKAHVDFLEGALGDAFDAETDKLVYDDFDFRARGDNATGLFENVYDDKGVFLALAQGFEDTGVRAYKGQAGELAGDNATLTAALQIHSIEARHAAMIRRMRGVKSWVTTPDYSGLGNAAQMAATTPIYAGENNKTQLGTDVTTVTTASALEVEEGWDEPLTMQQVLAIAGNFIK